MAGFALQTLAAGLVSGLLSTAQYYWPNETGEQVPAPTMGNLHPARACQARLPLFGHFAGGYVAPNASIAMSNDGGWCWFGFTQVFRQVLTLPPVRIAVPPSHGQAVVQTAEGRIGVAYQPAQGFVGSDSFTVRTDGPFPHDIPVTVAVAG